MMIEKFPSSTRERKVEYFSGAGHRDNVLINPPIDFVMESNRGSVTGFLSAKTLMSPKKKEVNMQKVEFF